MDLNRLIQQIVNTFFRRALNKGINMGIDHVARRGKAPGQMTEAERKQAQQGKDLAKRARQMAKITRRLGR